MKQFEAFRLDTSNECLWRDGAQIFLPPKPYAILRYLVERPGRLVTHDELLDALWPETYVQPQVLRTYVLDLRKVLGDDAGAPKFIQTLPKRGYCFVAPVTDCAGTDRGAAPSALSSGEKAESIVNREQEIARLHSLAQLAAAGQRQVVFVSGGAGIGKTALVDAFMRHVSPAIAARGQCVSGLSGKEEYYPVGEALSHLCASPDGERVCQILARMAPMWLPASERASNGTPHTPAVPAAERMPGDLCGALEELALEKPLILLLEDVHWADEPTLALISALARRRSPAKLMVLATFRPQDGSTEQSLKILKQDLLLRHLCVELALSPLVKGDVRKLLSRHLDQPCLPAGLDDYVHQHSEGNPLFAIAILEHLIAQEYLVREAENGAATWNQRSPFPELETTVPDPLAQMIELEIERLNQKDQRLLAAASLMSIAFPAWAVAAALDEDAADVEEACDELARRLYFVRRAGEDELPDGTRSAFYVFAHAMYREVLYQRQGVGRRARQHTRIAGRLAELFAGREASVAREIAQHYEAAGQWQPAMAALHAAGRHALERHAFAEAASLLDHALRLVTNLRESECRSVAEQIRGDLAVAREAMTPAASIGFQKLDAFWTGT